MVLRSYAQFLCSDSTSCGEVFIPLNDGVPGYSNDTCSKGCLSRWSLNERFVLATICGVDVIYISAGTVLLFVVILSFQTLLSSAWTDLVWNFLR